MAQLLGKSLDEIIADEKKATSKGGRGGSRGGSRGSRGGSGPIRSSRGRSSRTNPYGGRSSRPASGAAPNPDAGTWGHDLYENENGASAGFRRSRPAGGARQKNITTGVKLLVDNLHYGVSSEDIRSLFAEFSDVKKAEVVYDKSGRSLGKAYVVLSSREAAEAAIKKYDGVNLDEQPMKISIVGGTGTGRSGSSAPLMTSTGLKISAGGSGGRRVVVERDAGKPVRRGGSFTSRNRDEGRGSRQTARRGGRGGGRGGSRAGGKEPKPTAESLDAELDNYRAQAMEQDQ